MIPLMSCTNFQLRGLILIKRGWWIGQHWREPNGAMVRSFHGPNHEFQPNPPDGIMMLTREQMMEELTRTNISK